MPGAASFFARPGTGEEPRNAVPVGRRPVLPTFADPRSVSFMPLHPSAGADFGVLADLTDLFGDVRPYREKVDIPGLYIGGPPIERVKRSVRWVNPETAPN
jgi:hypothetical protein